MYVHRRTHTREKEPLGWLCCVVAFPWLLEWEGERGREREPWGEKKSCKCWVVINKGSGVTAITFYIQKRAFASSSWFEIYYRTRLYQNQKKHPPPPIWVAGDCTWFRQVPSIPEYRPSFWRRFGRETRNVRQGLLLLAEPLPFGMEFKGIVRATYRTDGLSSSPSLKTKKGGGEGERRAVSPKV